MVIFGALSASSGSVKSKRSAVFAFALIAAIAACLSGCGDDEKGACTWGSGFSGKCWDDFTAGQCNSMNGALHVGKKCSDFGYGTSTATLVTISEVSFGGGNDGVKLGWVELYNAGPDAVDLQEFSLVRVDADGLSSTVRLNGIIPSCGVFVVGSVDGATAIGVTTLDQRYAFDGSISPSTGNGGFVALFMAGGRLGTHCPLAAVVFGSGGDVVPRWFDCAAAPAPVVQAEVGVSYERVDWSTSPWMQRAVPAPREVSPALGCGGDLDLKWEAIVATY